MRGVLLRVAVLVILAAVLGGHVTELFDRWDQTLQTGREIDFTVVSIAACAGFALVAAKGAVRLLKRPSGSGDWIVERPAPAFRAFIPDTSVAAFSPPPLLPLRI